MKRHISVLLLVLLCGPALGQEANPTETLRSEVRLLRALVETQNKEIEQLKEALDSALERIEILEERGSSRRPEAAEKTEPAEERERSGRVEEEDEGIVTIKDTVPPKPAPRKKEVDEDKAEEAKPDVGVEFRIVKRTPIILGTTVRISYKIRVQSKPAREDIEAICRDIIDNRETKPYNALFFRFYTPDPDKPKRSKDLVAHAEWAPDGDWDKADTVQPGHYDKHELNIHMEK